MKRKSIPFVDVGGKRMNLGAQSVVRRLSKRGKTKRGEVNQNEYSSIIGTRVVGLSSGYYVLPELGR